MDISCRYTSISLSLIKTFITEHVNCNFECGLWISICCTVEFNIRYTSFSARNVYGGNIAHQCPTL